MSGTEKSVRQLRDITESFLFLHGKGGRNFKNMFSVGFPRRSTEYERYIRYYG